MIRPVLSRSPERSKGSSEGDERGVTLPELLVVIAIMGMIAVVLTMALQQIYNTTDRGSGELAVQHDLQTAATWLNRDVLSASLAKVDSPQAGVYRMTLEVPRLTIAPEVTSTISYVTYTYSQPAGTLIRDSGNSSLIIASHITFNPFPPPGTVIERLLTS